MAFLCRVLFVIVSCSSGCAAWTDPCNEGGAAPALDHSVFGEVLRSHVRYGNVAGISSTLVSYGALRQNPSRLRAYMRQLCTVDVATLPPRDALAVLINAYNAMLLAIVVHYDPPKSVLELNSRVPEGSIWKHKFMTLGGQRVSPDNVEHDLIRGGGYALRAGMPGEIHAAVNCASLSCPDLQPEPFEPARLLDQLGNASKKWLNNPTKNPGLVQGGLVLSKIFQWYGGDFSSAGGVKGFVRKYTTWQFDDGLPITHADYDWSLNLVNSTGGYSSMCRSISPLPLAAVATAAATFVAVFS